jgi:hypothetical protein
MPAGGVAVHAAGLADLIGYHDLTTDWNADATAVSGGTLADLPAPAASGSAPADLNDTPISSTDLDAVPSASDVFSSPTESTSVSFAVFTATADDAQDLAVGANASGSSTGTAVLASLANSAADTFGAFVADNLPNGAVAASTPLPNVGYQPSHADLDVTASLGAGAAAADAPFAMAEPAPAHASLASLANPPADYVAAPITDSTVGAGGATAAQVLQALDDSGLNVNGSGIKVGVLSDSFNDLGGAAADEADGALPPAADIDVIKDLASGGTDEGRAMMQIIHDIAPGASLAFYTAFDSEQDFANGILALAAAGSKVIVDDVGYFDEPFFQNGIVAQAIQTVEAEGVTYVTAAGNDASNGYQAAWTPISGTYDGTSLTDAENFGGSLVQTVTINTEGTGYDVPLLLEWNQAFGAATSDLELLVFNSRGQLVGTATNASDGEPSNPWVEYDFTKSGTYHVAIENLSGPDPGLIKEITEGDGLPATISGANVGTVFGHAMTPGAISAGAVSVAATPAFGASAAVSESFSSSGAGTELLFANNGTALSSPDQISPVVVSGVDDVATTVSGGLSDFYGTSAASASLAGAAAVILSADPNLTAAAVEQLMEETALPMANAAVSGAGLVQLDPAVADVESTAAPTLTITSTGGLTNRTTQTISGTIDTADAGLTVSIYDGTTLIGTATPNANGSWSKQVTLLSIQGAQTLTAQATDAAGNVGTSSSVTYTLDTIAPTLAITSTGVLTNQTTQSISGTIDAADAGLTVSIYDGTTLLGIVTPAANGSWSKQVALLSIQGAQTLTAQATDAAGNVGTSSPVTYTLDTIAPTLAITSTGVLTNQTTQSISGTIDAADAGLTVSIYDGTTLLGIVTPAANGSWSKQVTLLSIQGTQTLTAQATDAAGNVGTSSPVTYTLDTIPPTLTVVSTGVLTNQTTQTISGTIDAADAGLTVSIYDGTTLLGTVISGVPGAWSKQVTLLSTQGVQTITAQATDAAGNVGTSNSVTFTLDTTPPAQVHDGSVSLTAGTTVTIPESQLQFDDNLSSHAQEIYTVITGPADGTILDNGVAVTSFTQADVDSGLVAYKETSSSALSDSFTFKVTDAAGNQTVAQQFQFQISPAVAVLQTDTGAYGTTSLDEIGNGYALHNSGGSGPSLQYAGAPITVGEFGDWAPIGAVATATGYEVAWKETGVSSYQLATVDSNGNMVSWTAVISGSSYTLESAELIFHQDLNGDGVIGPAGTAIQTDTNSFGTTILTEVGNSYALDNPSGSGPILQYAGAPATVGEFGDWAPIGAVPTATGYEVAWKETGTSNYQLATVDSNGNMVSWTAVISGSSYTVESAELVFHQDLNGDGVIGPAGTLIQTDTNAFGTTSLTEVGNSFALNNTSGSGPVLQYSGAPITVGEFGNWAPIGAVPTAAGYEVAWKETGASEFQIATVDSNGNMVSWTPVISGSSYTLESAELVFNQDLNGDGVIGPAGTVIQTDTNSHGTTSLTEVGNSYALDNTTGSGPILQYAGAPVTAGEFGDWAPIGAVPTATGYEVAWKETGTSNYQLATVDNGGNMVSWTAVISGSSYTLESAELVFNQDLNGDSVIGPSAIVLQTDTNSFGTTSLTEVGNSYALDNTGGSGPILQYAGAPVTVGEFGDWAPIGAAPTATGYEVAWKETGTSNYQVATVDSSGNMVSWTAVISGTNATLESAELIFNQDLNGDGVIGIPPAGSHAVAAVAESSDPSPQPATIGAGATLELPGADAGPVTFDGATGALILDHASEFSGQLFNFTGNGSLSGSDQIDLRDIDFGAGTTASYTGTDSGGVLSVTDAADHTASIALAGDYTHSTFSVAGDGDGGTVVFDPVAAQSLAGGSFIFNEADAAGRYSVSVAPQDGGQGYIGSFTVDAGTMNDGQESVGWHFNADPQSIIATVTQSYNVSVAATEPSGGNTVATQTLAVTIGGPGNDTFVFKPGLGADVIANATSSDTIELDGFASVGSINQLQTALAAAQSGQAQSLFEAANGGHDTVINLGNHDSITLANVDIAGLHASNFIVHPPLIG